MPRFKITIEYSEVVEAQDAEEAARNFFEHTIYDTQSDPGSWIEEHMEVRKHEKNDG